MMIRRLLIVLCLFVSSAAFAQSADIGITPSDSPDSVAPDGNVTYTVTVSNSGPNAAASVSMSVFQNNTMLYQSITTPAGWTCPSLSPGYGGGFTCSTPSMAASTNAVFTVVLKAAKSQFGVNDQTINQLFTASSQTTSDPNSSNNAITVQTAYDAPNVDMQITGSGSPSTVAPDGNVTYTITVTNGGPDATTNATMSVVQNNTMLFQSISVPAGWSCPSEPVGYGGGFTCTASTFAANATSTFSVVLKAAKSQFGINDQTISQLFTTSSDWADPNNSNNAVTVQTSYDAPNADMQITATDSPDPVAPDGNVTYTVTVTNGGPDATTHATMNVILNNTMLFQSITVPAGWSCSPPAVNGGTSFTCTAASMAASSSAQFTVVLKAAKSQFGINDQTISQIFTTSSDWSDPNNANNTVTVQTAYVTPHADLQVTASDSPDPVSPDGNITYTVTVTNAGPDTATTATMNVILNNTLLFQSISVPSGWSCSPPAVNGGTSFSCTNPSFATGSSVFSIVLKAAKSQFGNTNQTISQTFTVSSAVADPTSANNSVIVQTSYVAPHADMQITAGDSPDPVSPDGNITYTVTVTNAGPDTATTATMNVILNNTLLFQSISVPSGWSCSPPAVNGGTSFSCTNSSFATGSSVFSIVLKAAKSQFGNTNQTISQTFTTTSDAFDSNNANNSATVTTSYVVPVANLAVTNSDSPDPVVSGSNITYTIGLTNNGPDTATNAILDDSLGSGVTFVSFTSPAGFTCTTPAVGAAGAIHCTNASFANGASVSATLVVKVTATSGTITNTATTSSDTSDNVTTNNTATAMTTVQAPPASADLSLTSGVNVVANIVTYTFTLHNGGPDPASNVVFTDALPSSLLFQSITAPGFNCTTPIAGVTGTISCTASSVASGTNTTFTLTTRSAPGASGNITNAASVTSATTDPNPSNSATTAPVVPAPAVSSEDIPTLSQWALIALGLVLGVAALAKLR